jgi:LL-diaminopimelate aminotransferase
MEVETTMQIAHRMQSLPAHFFAALSAKLSEMQSKGLDVIRLDEGSPDMPPDDGIIQALALSAENPGNHSYQPHRGTARLRQAWATMYRNAHGVELEAESEVLPLLGSKEGIFHIAMATINPGDVVLVPDPGYITYTRGALFAGGEVIYFPLSPELGYLPDFETISAEIARRAKILWLNYPNNPTTAVATSAFFTQAVEFAREYGILLCHDAAYTQVTFDGYHAPSLLEIPGAKEVAVEFNTLSKSHNMAGWRLGAALGSSQALRALYILKTNQDSGHFKPVLDAATAAMCGDQGWLAQRNEIYRQRRDAAVQALRQMGFIAALPNASIYIWSDIPTGWSSVDFARAALEEALVSVTPGTVFGQGGEGFMRLSLTAPLERITEAMYRLERWLGR